MTNNNAMNELVPLIDALFKLPCSLSSGVKTANLVMNISLTVGRLPNNGFASSIQLYLRPR